MKVQAGGGRPHWDPPSPRAGRTGDPPRPLGKWRIFSDTLGPKEVKIARKDEARGNWWRSLAVLTCKSSSDWVSGED
ncbi:hypothetical protein JTE90_000030 [Oedothorax gibbosus]|uniref:Uncharacterized protein n=1 Tax=Oedothorax gibbosus TaxID=931172 RepID=A0AAV6TCM8_9ARAC|nr:hypothetical protein JTE90_000030 [Oedothorax gibbosus]